MRITLIGYGEVGKILAEDLRAAGHALTVFDLKLLTAAGQAMAAHAAQHQVHLAADHADAVREAEVVISAVTASQTLAVATACAPALPALCWFVDFNSASPAVKQQAAAVVEGAQAVAAGTGPDSASARYLEVAVMTLISGYRIRVPLLLGGPHAQAALPVLRELGFSPALASTTLGVASATKLCRSVMIKGLEVMLIESLTTARHYGVEDAVLGSLAETYPGVDWPKQASYAFQRVIEHGQRRGEEMQEAARTVHDAGLQPLSAGGTAQRATWVAELAQAGVFGARSEPGFARSADWRQEADRLLTHLHRLTPTSDAQDTHRGEDA